MAEAISTIAAVIQISTVVVKLIKTIKDGPSEQHLLVAEINTAAALCQSLLDFAEIDAVPWAQTFQSLCNGHNSPLKQYQGDLEKLQKRLSPKPIRTPDPTQEQHGQPVKPLPPPRAWVNALKWPFNKDEVKELLARIERQKSIFNIAITNDNLRLTAVIHDQIKRIAECTDTIRINHESQIRREILARLSSIDFASTHRDVSVHRSRGTGQWFLDDVVFQAWLNCPSSTVLWCHGIPGCGKTMLSSLVIDHLYNFKGNDRSIGVIGIYFNHRDPHPTSSLLGSLLQQLAEQRDTLPLSIMEDQKTLMKVAPAILEMAPLYREIFVVIDALDECANRLDLLMEVQKLLQIATDTNFHILITGRTGITDIEQNFTIDLQIEIRSNEADIRLYLQESLHSSQDLSRWISVDPDFEAVIIDAILPRLSGMFLLARLYMEIIARIPTKREVRKSLQTLPEGVDDAYREAWDRICAQEPQQAALGKKIILWIICAQRPLRVKALQHGLAIEDGDEELDYEGLLDFTYLTSFCAGLVIFNKESNRMSLVHPTTNEYFVKHQAGLIQVAHDQMAVACTTQLLMKACDGVCLNRVDFQKRREGNPFFAYAAVNWGSHVRISASERVLFLARRLLCSDRARLAAAQALLSTSPWGTELSLIRPVFSEFTELSINALHLAACFGLVELVEDLLDGTADIDSQDETGATAVHWALMGRQNATLELLLDRGANVHIQKQCKKGVLYDEIVYSHPLHIAAASGNIAAISLLLCHGAEINKSYRVEFHRFHPVTASADTSFCTTDVTALAAACIAGQASAMAFLQQQGADPLGHLVLGHLLGNGKPSQDASQAITELVRSHLSRIFAIEPTDIDIQEPLLSYGMDSLIATELRNWFLKAVNTDVPISEMLSKDGSIANLAFLALKNSRYNSSDSEGQFACSFKVERKDEMMYTKV